MSKRLSGSERLVREIKSVRIGATIYPVRVSHPGECNDPQGCIHDENDTPPDIIHLKKSIPWRTALSVLLHECVHGIVFDRGDFPLLDWVSDVVSHKKGEVVDLSGNGIVKMVDEHITKAMEKGLVTLMMDNPKLIRLLVSEFSKTKKGR